MFSDHDRPRLARGVRLRYDAVRSTQMLLRPEGAVELNPSAAAVLELCDGERTVGTIIAGLEAKFAGARLGDDVRELLADLEEVGVVVHAHS
jgi:pyrroloquinoline quinone biosynthesis protein D